MPYGKNDNDDDNNNDNNNNNNNNGSKQQMKNTWKRIVEVSIPRKKIW